MRLAEFLLTLVLNSQQTWLLHFYAPPSTRPNKRTAGNAVFLLFVVLQLHAEPPAVTSAEAKLLQEVADQFEQQPGDAIRRLEQATQNKSASAAIDFKLGEFRLLTDQAQASISNFRTALSKAPEFRQAREALARALLSDSQWAESESEIKRLLTVTKAGRPRKELLMLLGYALLNQQRVRSAEMVYREALLADADDTDALTQIAHCLLEQERHAEARALLQELLQRQPMSETYWRLLANLDLSLGHSDSARARLTCLHRLGLAGVEDLLRLAELFARDQMQDQGAACLNGLDFRNASSNQVTRAVELLLRLDQLDQAQRLLAGARDLPPESRLYLSARVALEREDRTAAGRYLTELLEIDPLHAKAMLHFGDIQANENTKAAVVWYERAARSEEASIQFEALLRLRLLALDEKDYAAAIRYCERAYQLREDPGLRRYIEQLRRTASLAEQ